MDKKVKIGYQHVIIERETPTFQKQSDSYGEYDHRKNTITIQSGQPLDTENKEEVVINTMTNALAQVFRDNKWLLPYFKDKFK